MKLSIKYSVDFEVERIYETLKKIEWFEKEGYKVSLPKDFDETKFKESTSLNKMDIKRTVLKEYEEKIYLTPVNYLKDKWPEIENIFFQNLKKIPLKQEGSYYLYLTKYGVAGSYHTPDIIIINIQKKYEIGLIRTICHEIIHLLIQPIIEKYKINHWTKERIVDLIFKNIIPKLYKEKTLPIKTEYIDKIFEENYPDIELVLEKLSKQ